MRARQPDPTDKELIVAIRVGGPARESAWRHISKDWGDYCSGTAIKRTECLKEEAKTAFSIAVVGVDKKIRNTDGYDFLKTASLKTYLTKSTINASWMILRQRKSYIDLDDEKVKLPEVRIELPGESNSDWFRREKCREAMEKALEGIGERCKKILTMFNDNFGMDAIAEEMGFKNEDSAKKEKYKCQVKFKEYLIKNPPVRDLIKENCYG